MVANHAQIIQLFNITYLPNNLMKKEIYECKPLASSDIYFQRFGNMSIYLTKRALLNDINFDWLRLCLLEAL